MSRFTPRSRKYWALRMVVKREEPNCWLCGEEIDPLLKYPDHWSFSVDHIITAKDRPDLAEVRTNMHAAHLKCNWRRNKHAPRSQGFGSGVINVQDF